MPSEKSVIYSWFSKRCKPIIRSDEEEKWEATNIEPISMVRPIRSIKTANYWPIHFSYGCVIFRFCTNCYLAASFAKARYYARSIAIYCSSFFSPFSILISAVQYPLRFFSVSIISFFCFAFESGLCFDWMDGVLWPFLIAIMVALYHGSFHHIIVICMWPFPQKTMWEWNEWIWPNRKGIVHLK